MPSFNPPKPRSLGAIFSLGFRLSLVMVCLLSLMGYLGRWHWILDLTAHFKVQYLWVGVTTFIYFSLKRRRQVYWLVLALCCVALNLAEVLPWYLPAAQADTAAFANGESLKVLSVNVNFNNDNYADVLSLVSETQPDIAVFQEVTPAWLAALEPLQAILPYRLNNPQDTYYGNVLYSAIPLENPTVNLFGRNAVASLLADVTINNQTVSLIATHLLPPHRPQFFAARNRQLRAMGQYVQTLDHPAVMVGDLNITPWSLHYRDFVDTTELQNSRRGLGVVPTWPVSLPLLSVPIDHCLISPGIQVLSTQVAPSIGSDHRPLLVQIAL